MRRSAFAGLLLMVVGCSDRSDPNRFYPQVDQARNALDSSLNAWMQGAPAGEVTGASSPTVVVIDSHRSPGQSLKAFEILGVAPGDGPRVFTVKLTMSNPAAETKARYIVVGIDPIWVFRQEDYDMINHWDHPMQKAGDAKQPASTH